MHTLRRPARPAAHALCTRARAQAYARNSKSSLARLQEVWLDVELPEGQQVEVLEGVIARAHAVWEDAVSAAEAQQTRLRGEVEAALREAAAIREELGDGDDAREARGRGWAGAAGRRHTWGARTLF
jgi:hypothetical protein